MPPKADQSSRRIERALRDRDWNLPWIARNGRVAFWAFPGGWRMGAVDHVVADLDGRERQLDIFAKMTAVEGDPLKALLESP
jgi:hypothetical protein